MAQNVELVEPTEPVKAFHVHELDTSDLYTQISDATITPPNLPEPSEPVRQPVLIYFRNRLFGVYKRLFSLVTLSNLAALAYVASQYTEPTLPNAALLSTPIAANLFAACLLRTEDFINLLYASVIWVPLSLPLSIRRRLANIYEFGGVHSGAGVACSAWALLFCIQITRASLTGEPVSPGVLTATFLILFLLLFMVAAAQPAFRSAQHNIFEAVHRFCGWGSLILFWVLSMLLSSRLADSRSQTLATALSTTPTFYLLIATTILIILPWLRLRRIVVHSTTPSTHVTRLQFSKPHTAKPTQTVRISTSPLLEWHSFATIPPFDPTTTAIHRSRSENHNHNHNIIPHSFSVLVSSAGDWTNSVIADHRSAQTYWIRGIPVTGVTQVARLFRSVVVVATGSGIGPCLSLMAAIPSSSSTTTTSNRSSNRLIWSTQSPTSTYGEAVLHEVYAADPKAVVWDTTARGRPDLVVLAAGLVRETGAEAVVVVSNRNVTRRVVLGLRAKRILAYGPIFDS